MTDSDHARLLGTIRAYQRSQAVAVAARLGIADLVADAPVPVGTLAGKTGCDADALYRLLRALAAIGVLHEDDDSRFSLTGAGEYLRRDHPLSLDPVARMFCADYEWRAWGVLEDAVRTGETAVRITEGTDVWEYRRAHPEAGDTFDGAMRTLTRVAAAGVLAAHDFSRYRTVADVGGGTGAMLAALLRAHPGLHGILCDLPHVVDRSGPVLADVRDRVDVVAGSFFDSVPAGADCYLLRRILHDWPDDECRSILARVREAMPEGGRLLVLDAVVGAPNTDPEAAFLDLMMLVSASGRERTAPQWEGLLGDAGFRIVASTRGDAEPAGDRDRRGRQPPRLNGGWHRPPDGCQHRRVDAAPDGQSPVGRPVPLPRDGRHISVRPLPPHGHLLADVRTPWHSESVTALRLRLVARRHVDLRRTNSALCLRSR